MNIDATDYGGVRTKPLFKNCLLIPLSSNNSVITPPKKSLTIGTKSGKKQATENQIMSYHFSYFLPKSDCIT